MKDFLNFTNHTKMVIIIFGVLILWICFYCIKNFKTMDIQLRFLLVIVIVGFIAGIFISEEEDRNFALLKSNFSLTSGSIEEYIVPNLKGHRGNTRNSIRYIYKVGKEFISHSYYENYFISIPNDKPDLSLLYLVIYEKTNPRNSFILLNYPINSSDDLEKYKKMFKHGIPADAIKQDN